MRFVSECCLAPVEEAIEDIEPGHTNFFKCSACDKSPCTVVIITPGEDDSDPG